jgi:hypothetical protein
VEDRTGLDLGHSRFKAVELDDVEHPQIGAIGHPLALAGGEVVDHRHLIAVREQGVDDV